MFQWRLKLREARQALAAGRVDEARQLLGDETLQEFLPAKQLAGEVAEKFVERGRQRIAWGESQAGMQDLGVAEKLGGMAEGVDAARHEYAWSAAEQAIAHFTAGDPEAAGERIDRARRRGVVDETLRSLGDLAQRWCEARRLADTGEMSAAQSSLARAVQQANAVVLAGNSLLNRAGPQVSDRKGRSKMDLQPALGAIEKETALFVQRASEHEASRQALHTAASAENWTEALSIAEATLKLAPADSVALGIRRRAWKEVGLDLTRSHHGRPRRNQPGRTPLAMDKNSPNRPGRPNDRSRKLAQSLRSASDKQSTQASKPTAHDTSASAEPVDRQMLWVDAVGGYLMCFDNEVVLGQPVGNQALAIPILADVSRRHAVLRREGGAYVLQPLGKVFVDGQLISGPTVLGDKHHIQLGGSAGNIAGGKPGKPGQGGVQIVFNRPHALSATARMEIVSGHRTTPSADAILLVADSCVLGPSSHSHIRCNRWKEDVILFRKSGQLCCRSSAPLAIDEKPVEGQAEIRPGSRVEGEDFALCVEEV